MNKNRKLRNFSPFSGLLVLFLIPAVWPPYTAFTLNVLPGIDVLLEQDLDLLTDRNVGLITNHTGLTASGSSTIDVLSKSEKCRLIKLFSPEHGIRGLKDTPVGSGRDAQTGLPIESLYGRTLKPTPQMLDDLDILVFDIQDIGTRFYTYIGTMALCMQASAEKGIPFIVLDRPNPVGGLKVSGAVPPESLCGKLTCIYPIPTRHGMTVGELARLFNDHFGIACNLTVVPMKGWERWMYYDDTGLTWANPSPNMKTLNGAILYPGLGIAEGTRLSCARGTEKPFEMYGAPYLDPDRLLNELSKRKIPGLRFRKTSFVPRASGHRFRGEECRGVFVEILDRNEADPILGGLHLVQALMKTHPGRYRKYPLFDTLVGDPEVWDLLKEKGESPENIMGRWRPALEEFKKTRRKYLIY